MLSCVTFDQLVDALLNDFDRHWRTLTQMPHGHPDRPSIIHYLDEVRGAALLLLDSMPHAARRGAQPKHM